MKKNITFATILAISSTLCSCKQIGYDVVSVDDTVTTLYVGNYDGGAGHDWWNKLIADFEDANKDVEFEPGKKGVKIEVINDKDNYIGNALINKIKDNTEDMYITGTMSYTDFVSRGLVADITDIITDSSEEKSIEDRMYPAMKQSFNLGTESNPKYYGAPSIGSMSGIVYDVDLFEDENLFISKSSTGDSISWTGKNNKSLGMDGLEGTFDDGLPETYEQLKKLMTRMVQNSIIPFTWSGLYPTYRTRFMNYIWASYEGENDYQLNYNFNGTDSDVGKIDYSNGYLLQKQNGKYAAIKVAEYLVKHSELYSPNAFKSSQSHTQAQTDFLTSVEKNKRVAMILEGTWWENEARGIFDSMVKYSDDYAYGKRRFGYMPFPKFLGSEDIPDSPITKNPILFEAGSGTFIISSHSKKIDLAKKFLKYVLKEKSMAHFTATTGVTLPYEYELTDEQYNSLTYYGKSIWDVMHDPNTEVIVPVLNNQIKAENSSYFSSWDWGSKVTVNGVVQSLSEPMMAFYSYPSITAEDYFNGLSVNFSKTSWEDKLSRYFDK